VDSFLEELSFPSHLSDKDTVSSLCDDFFGIKCCRGFACGKQR
jgi:hypothetical protein